MSIKRTIEKIYNVILSEQKLQIVILSIIYKYWHRHY